MASSLKVISLAERLELGCGELDLQRRQVLFQVIKRQGARNRQHRRRAPEEPSKSDLLLARVVPPGDLGERSATVSAQGKERDENDAVRGAVINDGFGRALGKVVVVLHSDNGHHPPGALYLLDSDVGDSDVADLALVAVILDDGQAFLDRSVRVDAMQVIEVDGGGLQLTKALLELGAQDFWAAAPGATEPALGCHDAASGSWRECLPDRLLALSARVQVSGVDHLRARGDRRPDERDVFSRPRQSVRSQTDPGHVDVADLHVSSMMVCDDSLRGAEPPDRRGHGNVPSPANATRGSP